MPASKRIITCEHASNRIPPKYAHLFTDKSILTSHQGWDIGANQVAQAIADKLDVSLYLAGYSRLLIELNRSINHPKLFSPPIKALTKSQQQQIIAEYYSPYRNQILQEMHDVLEQGHTIQHISVHSFTPIFNGIKRNCDIGLLYDPNRILEKHLALRWQTLLRAEGLKVRLNYPYRGISDGFVTYLRKVNPVKRYQGIELEINQKLFDVTGQPQGKIIEQIVNTLVTIFRPF